MIVLKQGQYQEIVDYARKFAPIEACGLLGGRVTGDDKIVEKVYFLTNIDNSPEHFSMDAKEQFAAVKDMRQNCWTLLGNYHSHPASPSRPSEEDKRLAFDPAASYLILSLLDTVPVLKGFKIAQGTVSEEKIKII
ncbi:MAG: M67 family metallopeptidase [Pelosinus sp.]|nr:M67 family metallopeptidase [Pelosinus sp.]